MSTSRLVVTICSSRTILIPLLGRREVASSILPSFAFSAQTKVSAPRLNPAIRVSTTPQCARMSTTSCKTPPDAQEDGPSPSEEECIISLPDQKNAVRSSIKAALRSLDKEAISKASAAVAEQLLTVLPLEKSRGVSIYLSMPHEIDTSPVRRKLFELKKKVYIPTVTGSEPTDMRMFPLESNEEVDSFPLTKWKIPEPTMELVMSRPNGVFAGDIDFVVVPGVAFDSSCNRLGHGRGYYDSFLDRVSKSNGERGSARPITVGVCFDEQVVDCVPVSSTDIPMDFVVTPSQIFKYREA